MIEDFSTEYDEAVDRTLLVSPGFEGGRLQPPPMLLEQDADADKRLRSQA
jgi:hypothetical protein